MASTSISVPFLIPEMIPQVFSGMFGSRLLWISMRISPVPSLKPVVVFVDSRDGISDQHHSLPLRDLASIMSLAVSNDGMVGGGGGSPSKSTEVI